MQFKKLRQRMVDCQIRPVDVIQPNLLQAFLTIEREKFVPEAYKLLAYAEEEIPLAKGEGGRITRCMLRPAALAKLLQLLDIHEQDHLLIVGAGTGYSAAISSYCVHSVVALEEEDSLLAMAKTNLSQDQFSRVSVVSGSLAKGCAQLAPYDRILVEGRIEIVPDQLLSQLAEGGSLVVAEGDGVLAQARLYRKEHGNIAEQFRFFVPAPLLPGFGKVCNFQL